MRALSLAAALAFLAQGASALETAAFLTTGVGARELGMGGAATALSDDAHALYWNPAGLARLEKREVGASHAELYDNTRMDYLAYAHPTSQGTFSAGLTYLAHPTIQGRDAQGRLTSGYGASDAAVAVGYARKLDLVDIGVSGKYIRSHIASAEAQTLALDAGLRRRFGQLSLGAALRNVGPGLKYGDQRNDLPLRLAIGAGYKLAGGHALAAELVNGPRGAGTDVALGGELQAAKNFYLRGGYTTQSAIEGGSGFDAARGLSLGVGFRNERWSLDYAIMPSGELGQAHRFSLGARF